LNPDAFYKKNNKMKLDPKRNLLKQPVFWIVNMFLLVVSGFIAVSIIQNGEYSLSLTVSGFRMFMNDFKFPITISALIIPASALIATIHRSEQLSTQIGLLMDQNNFANYYKHFEEFEKYLERQFKNRDKRAIDGREYEVYRSFYTKAREGDYQPSVLLIDSLGANARAIINIANEFLEKGGDFWEFFDALYPIFNEVVGLTALGCSPIFKRHFNSRFNKEVLRRRNMPRAVYNLMDILFDVFEDSMRIIKFENRSPEGLKDIIELIDMRGDLRANGRIFISDQPGLELAL